MRAVFNALVLGVLTGFWSAVAILAVPFMRWGSTTWVAQTWSKQVTWLCSVDVTLEGEVPTTGSYVVLANHTSHFDVLSLYSKIRLDMRPVAKRELGFIPLFGWVLALGAAIMIDRKSRARAVASIERAAKTIRGGRSVLMFPEGTRTPPNTVGPMKKGAFHLALAAQVPVLPVGVIGTGDILLPGDWKIRGGAVTVRVGAPIATAGRGDDAEDRAWLMAEVEKALVDLTKGG
ncbi:MAG: lysophospholipid acyltransferase family protein [Deltaproteobacteria bacterium]